MATWREIGEQNYAAGRELLKLEQYRSSVSRFYYAAFSLLTHELSEAGVTFGNNGETPSHQALPGLIKRHLPLSYRRQCVAIVRRLYAVRITADYQRRTIDEAVAQEAQRDAAQLLRYLGGNDG